MDECIDSFAEAAIPSALDENRGYIEREREESDRDESDSASYHELYWIIDMPFGPGRTFEIF